MPGCRSNADQSCRLMHDFTPLPSLIGGILIGVSASAMLLLRIFLPIAFDFGVLRSWWTIAIAGLLVGFGTRMANGCTSGHGICGISRASARSIVATAIFMGSGVVIVFVIN